MIFNYMVVVALALSASADDSMHYNVEDEGINMQAEWNPNQPYEEEVILGPQDENNLIQTPAAFLEPESSRVMGGVGDQGEFQLQMNFQETNPQMQSGVANRMGKAKGGMEKKGMKGGKMGKSQGKSMGKSKGKSGRMMMDDCPCAYAKDPGQCAGYSEVYFFNTASSMCEMFIYGLCGGNANRFSSQMECEKECGRFMRWEYDDDKKEEEEN